MTQLSSFHITFKQPLSTTQILKINKQSSKSDHQIYLHQNHLIADASHLTKLLSFFLFVNTEEPILMIIDGKNVEEMLQSIQDDCGDCIVEVSERSSYNEGQISRNTSISV
ncbi:hypothetical protein [Halobacillus sp. Marseille-Q1614]|uniref:hypothetical protein n=1 Tax=Halobacillus sp. Marseille-Q1614 TaxID=2709134 RepID=UPI00156FF7CC|nr:hypothetical protein [Halobacillus sp. Marseille-Q1614]